MLLEKSIKAFSKPSGRKCHQHYQVYIHVSNISHTQKIIPGHEKVLTLQKPVPSSNIEKKIRVLFADKF